MKRQIDVVGAVIVRDGLVLCALRGGDGPLAGMWEFPGGKIEPGESPVDALAREIREELLCQVLVGQHIATTTYEYDFATVTLTTFYCTLTRGEPTNTEHDELRWVEPARIAELRWAPADAPAIERIAQVADTTA